MGDIHTTRPDHAQLFGIASEQHGYFTAEQARQRGFGWDLLTHHTRTGRFLRVRRGLYRLRDYPSSAREDIVVAWIAVGKDVAVVSHETALEMLGLSNVIPAAIHLTVPRARRHLPRLPGVVIHTTTRPLQPVDVAVREGIRVTAATRTILDAAEAGSAPEQVELAITQAIERGLATAHSLRKAAVGRNRRVVSLIENALSRLAA